MTISFNIESVVKLNQRLLLKKFIKEMVILEKASIGKIDFIFCSDDFLLNINVKFLNHNYYTDIITFDLKENDSIKKQGEVYISVDRIRENAEKFNIPMAKELHRVIFHGVLHLCGYEDKSVVQKRKMRKKEDYYLSEFDLYVSRGTI